MWAQTPEALLGVLFVGACEPAIGWATLAASDALTHQLLLVALTVEAFNHLPLSREHARACSRFFASFRYSTVLTSDM